MVAGKPETRLQKPAASGPIIGIDLGTTYSCVAVWQDSQDRAEVIGNDQGNRTTPSFVAFTDKERLIGEAAKNQAASNPENTIFDAKRLIGRAYDDADVKRDMRHWPFKVVRGSKGKAAIEVMHEGQKKVFDPEQISSMILSRMKQTAEAYLGCEVNRAVITVPAYFNDSQRQATRDAGMIAGLEVERIINEPTAAALAYGIGKVNPDIDVETNILVFDLGGGTFDVSLLTQTQGMFEVKATSGNPHLGGEDFDSCLVKHCQAEFQKKHGINISENKRALRRLLTTCERAKRTLSESKQTTIEIEALAEGIDFNLNITQAKFNSICAKLFESTLEPVKDVLESAKLSKDQIDEVVLVGGSTRIPKIRTMISEFFGGKDLNRSVNADEAVALGAAIQGGILSKSKSTALAEILLVDVIPLSLGVAVVDPRGRDFSVMDKLIERNHIVPTHASKEYTVARDGQDTVEIDVYQGEFEDVSRNLSLGHTTLRGISPNSKKNVTKIKVTFEVDENGVLSIAAEELRPDGTGSKKSLKVDIQGKRLSKREIDAMVAEAQRLKEQDDARAASRAAMADLEEYIQSNLEWLDSDPATSLARDERETARAALDAEAAWLEEYPESAKDEVEERMRALEQILGPMRSQAETRIDDLGDESS